MKNKILLSLLILASVCHFSAAAQNIVLGASLRDTVKTSFLGQNNNSTNTIQGINTYRGTNTFHPDLMPLTAGSGVTITTSGHSRTIAATGGGGISSGLSEIIFNDAGTFTGDAGLTYDKTTTTIKPTAKGAGSTEGTYLKIQGGDGGTTSGTGGSIALRSGAGYGGAQNGEISIDAGGGANQGDIYLYGDDLFLFGDAEIEPNTTGGIGLTVNGRAVFTGTASGATPTEDAHLTPRSFVVAQSNALQTAINGKISTGAAAGGDLTGSYPDPTLAAVGTAGTYEKVTTDSKGRVTSGGDLVAADIPSLAASKITSGTLDLARVTSAGASRVLFNDAGTIAGHDGLMYNKASRRLGPAPLLSSGGLSFTIKGGDGEFTPGDLNLYGGDGFDVSDGGNVVLRGGSTVSGASGFVHINDDATVTGALGVSGAATFYSAVVAPEPTATNHLTTVHYVASRFIAATNGSYVAVVPGSDISENGAALISAYSLATALTPHGLALAGTNRASVLMFPGTYKLTGLELGMEFVDLVGIGQKESIRIVSDTVAIAQSANDVRLKNFTCITLDDSWSDGSGDPEIAAYYPVSNLPLTVIEDVVFDCPNGQRVAGQIRGNAMLSGVEYSGTYKRVSCLGGFGFGGYHGTASGYFEDCFGDGSSDFTGEGSAVASGVFVRCKTTGDFGFAGEDGIASGLFIDCEHIGDGGILSTGEQGFGGGGHATGRFIRCRSGVGSFGAGGLSDSQSNTGTFEDCVGGLGSFGGSSSGANEPGGNMSGTMIRCAISSSPGAIPPPTDGPLWAYVTGTIRDCAFAGNTANASAIPCVGAGARLYNITAIANGTGKSIDTIGNPITEDVGVTAVIAHCRTNKGIGANVTNLINTPYNVDDLDIAE